MPRPTITPPNLSSPKAAVNHLNTENTPPVEYLVLIFSAWWFCKLSDHREDQTGYTKELTSGTTLKGMKSLYKSPSLPSPKEKMSKDIFGATEPQFSTAVIDYLHKFHWLFSDLTSLVFFGKFAGLASPNN